MDILPKIEKVYLHKRFAKNKKSICINKIKDYKKSVYA